MLLILAIILFLAGWWRIPSHQYELKNPLAPYRALSGIVLIAIALLCFLAGRGAL